MQRFSLFLLLWISSAALVHAEARTASRSSSHSSGRRTISLAAFEASGMYLSQSGGANLLTGRFAWTPCFRISGPFRLSLVGSIAPSKSLASASTFWTFSAQAMLGLYPGGFTGIEVGGGIENWQSDHLNYYTLGGNLSIGLGSLKLLFFQRIVLGYSLVLVQDDNLSQFRAGLGFDF